MRFAKQSGDCRSSNSLEELTSKWVVFRREVVEAAKEVSDVLLDLGPWEDVFQGAQAFPDVVDSNHSWQLQKRQHGRLEHLIEF